MLGAIAGDIIGSRFEGGPPPPPGFPLFHPDCRFTDDTVCTVAVAAALLDGTDMAGTLRAFVRRHPDRGYGGMFLRWALDDAQGPYGSWGNGAPMRGAAVGWLTEEEADARDLAALQANVTHNHPAAVAAAQAVAEAIVRFRRGDDVAAVRDHIARTYRYDLRPESALASSGFDVSAAGTTPAALAAAFEAEDWEAAVRTAVGLGGDTDTLACITGAVAEARFGLPAPVAAAARDHLAEDLAMVLTHFEARVAAGPPGTQAAGAMHLPSGSGP
ncbi:ADP-ribosylglycohydrolase family protein [uncultured Rhodospira sp.]|uniref:ADP-ribosylglycohydrolase family protein n=1 Tax=uncultured Rhodospira sp. TaxID=1936189 RepID=UPI00260E1468|nr:ADP-ribosylglycohydrolase family protein [uncultured Rhodospira sp.]